MSTSFLDFNSLDQEYGLPQGTLFNLAGAESGFQPNAKSPTGPQGLFQQTAGFQGSSTVNTDPYYQANAAGAFLQPYAASGNLGGGFAAYTEGPTGGAGLTQSPQYTTEAAAGNQYAQALLGLSNDVAGSSGSTDASGTLTGSTDSSSSLGTGFWAQLLGDAENLASRTGLVLIGLLLLAGAAFALSNHSK